ncbi:hypothetical protein [Halosolutus gelatinilyticus]|uniref:hypothetical protein n=1 Tax=Halosolutus gelatinilyticus TaxID=2931975 RepID=UPI001FF177F1|nr:hypothetical protein [Halosolutus gelatinilyticus]
MGGEEVVLKGEIHTSRADHTEERNLLVEGVDTLVLEGQAKEAQYGLRHHWFAYAMAIFQWVIVRNLYTDNRLLIDLADAQGADIEFTREADTDIVTNSSLLVEIFSAAVFYILAFISILYGLLLGDVVTGALLLLMSALLPILIIRVYETMQAEENRDEIMADIISDAAERGGRVVAIMGGKHFEVVPDHLPDDIDPNLRPPRHGVISLQTLKDIGVPVFEAFSDLFLLYTILLLIVRYGVMVL